MMAFVVMAIGWLSSRARSDSSSRRRLDLIEQGLQHPTLDDATRTELLRLLAEEQRRQRPFFERLAAQAAVWRSIWFGVSWLMFVGGVTLVICDEIGLVRVDDEAMIGMAIAGFVMLTLPIGLRELNARAARASTTDR
jgi:hypothetical protein